MTQIMYAEFFKSDRPRHSNPTYSSNHIQSTMLFPGLTYNYKNQSTMLPRSEKGGEARENYSQMMKIEMPNHRRSKKQKQSGQSNLSSYGSSSLDRLPKVTDKDVFENQKKNYNIINLSDKEYKESIKMFPKFRNQRKTDPSHQTRQAFIMGRPQLVLKNNRKQEHTVNSANPQQFPQHN